MRRRGLALALAAGIGAACSSGSDPGATGARTPPATPSPTEPATERVLPACDEHAPRAPAGFRAVGMREVTERDHRGIHVRYRGDGGATIHYLVGISGEIGEGLSFRRTVSLADDVSARLLGAGRRWVAVWDLPPPCGQAAALATGTPRGEFLQLLARAISAR